MAYKDATNSLAPSGRPGCPEAAFSIASIDKLLIERAILSSSFFTTSPPIKHNSYTLKCENTNTSKLS